MHLCTKCLSLNLVKIDSSLQCKDCLYIQSISNYNKKLKSAKDSVRFGYQYRKRLAYDSKRNLNLINTYHLKELHDAFAFIGLAAISGIIGNFSSDKLKQALNSILKDSLIIEINDKEFQAFLKSEAQQKMFLKYIEEYRNKKVGKPKKKAKEPGSVKEKK